MAQCTAACGWATRRCLACSSRPGPGFSAPGRDRYPLPGLRAAGAGAPNWASSGSTSSARPARTTPRPSVSRVPGAVGRGPATITYLEFRADYHVELRFADGRVKEIPFLQLPISKLPGDFFPLTCRTCVDYTNVLADITVGYMAGRASSGCWSATSAARSCWACWATRSARRARQRRQTPRPGDGLPEERAARRRWPAAAPAARLAAAAGRLADAQGRPARPRVRPRRVEMKAVETVVHLRREQPRRAQGHGARPRLGAGRAYGLAPTAGGAAAQIGTACPALGDIDGRP